MEQQVYANKRGEPAAVQLEVADAAAVDYSPGVVRHANGRVAVSAAPTQPASVADAPPVARASRMYLFVKRALDIGISLFLLALFFVPLLLIALVIRLESPGPALYRRRVLAWQRWDETLGTGQLKTFDAYKLRTMIPDAEEYLKKHPHLFSAYQKDWKLQDDPRVTRLGAFLRSSSIDELPQLINVLKGEMTLIGPRMITAPELSRYGRDGSRLLGVKPGLTGLWQVSGRQELSYEERVQLDMVYIETRSLVLDFEILFKTIKCVLLRQGAY